MEDPTLNNGQQIDQLDRERPGDYLTGGQDAYNASFRNNRPQPITLPGKESLVKNSPFLSKDHH
jgi:hypothetical protein